MAAPIVGKYILAESENFEEFLKELGVGIIKRNLAKAATLTATITQDGDQYTIKTSAAFQSYVIKFKLGEEFDEHRIDDAKVKSTITLEGNKMTHVQRGDKEVLCVREFTQEGMMVVAKVNNVTCNRFYKRLV